MELNYWQKVDIKLESLTTPLTLSVPMTFLWIKIIRSDVSRYHQTSTVTTHLTKVRPWMTLTTNDRRGKWETNHPTGKETEMQPVTLSCQKKKAPANTTIALESNRHEITSADSHSKRTWSFFYLTNIARHFRPQLQSACGLPPSPLRLCDKGQDRKWPTAWVW
jgi:hypothetical protein